MALPFGLQVWSQRNAAFGRFVKTTLLSFADGLVLLALGAIPLVALKAVKIVRNAWSRRTST